MRFSLNNMLPGFQLNPIRPTQQNPSVSSTTPAPGQDRNVGGLNSLLNTQPPVPTFTPSEGMPFGGIPGIPGVVGGRPFARPVTPEEYQSMQDYYEQDRINQANRFGGSMVQGTPSVPRDFSSTAGPKPAAGTPGSPFNADYTYSDAYYAANPGAVKPMVGPFGGSMVPTFTPSEGMPFGGVGSRPFARPVTPEEYQRKQDYYEQDRINQANRFGNAPKQQMPVPSPLNSIIPRTIQNLNTMLRPQQQSPAPAPAPAPSFGARAIQNARSLVSRFRR